MRAVRKLRDTARWIENVADEEAPRPKPEPQNDEDVDERQAEMSVVPTQGGGVACLARLGALLGGAAVAIALLAGCDKDTTGTPMPAPIAACDEDEPCWDCKTMGNRQCGEGDVRR